jgi:hypothetical protein
MADKSTRPVLIRGCVLDSWEYSSQYGLLLRLTLARESDALSQLNACEGSPLDIEIRKAEKP